MKRILIAIFAVIVLVGCGNESELLTNTNVNEYEHSYSNVQTRLLCASDTSTSGLTDEQKALIYKLDAINDSIIAQNPPTVTKATNNDLWDFSIIVGADIRGWFYGFKQGLKSGKGIFGNIATATLTAVTMAVVTSLVAALTVMFNSPDADVPALSTIQENIAITWNSDYMNSELEKVKREHPDFNDSQTDEELKFALWHNLALDKYDEGVIYPKDVLYNAFSESQLNYFRTNSNFNSFYKSAPSLIDGTIIYNDYFDPNQYRFEETIFNRFNYAVINIDAWDPSFYNQQLQSLSIQYINEVQNSSVVNEVAAEHLITTFYLSNLSYWHWTKKVGVEIE